MKTFVVLCGLLAVCTGASVRQKRSWSSGWNTALDAVSNGWSTGVGTVASGWRGNGDWSSDHTKPAAKVITVNKIENVQREVSVPQVVHEPKVISEPQVVTVMAVVPVSTSNTGLYSGKNRSGYGSGFTGGFTTGSASGS